MALPSTTWKSTRMFSITRGLVSNRLNASSNCLAFNYRYKYDNSSREGSSQNTNWKSTCQYGMAAGLAAIALGSLMPEKTLIAEEKEDSNIDQEIMNQENR